MVPYGAGGFVQSTESYNITASHSYGMHDQAHHFFSYECGMCTIFIYQGS